MIYICIPIYWRNWRNTYKHTRFGTERLKFWNKEIGICKQAEYITVGIDVGSDLLTLINKLPTPLYLPFSSNWPSVYNIIQWTTVTKPYRINGCFMLLINPIRFLTASPNRILSTVSLTVWGDCCRTPSCQTRCWSILKHNSYPF